MSDPRPSDPATPDNPGQRPFEPALTRSEEELVVDTELVATGRARLVKRVETETITRTIELRREVLSIEPIEQVREQTDAHEHTASTLDSGILAPGSFQEGTVEIVLMQEEALITTQLVPRERVRLTKQITTEQRAIDADLQVEHIDLEQRPSHPNDAVQSAGAERDDAQDT